MSDNGKQSSEWTPSEDQRSLWRRMCAAYRQAIERPHDKAAWLRYQDVQREWERVRG